MINGKSGFRSGSGVTSRITRIPLPRESSHPRKETYPAQRVFLPREETYPVLGDSSLPEGQPCSDMQHSSRSTWRVTVQEGCTMAGTGRAVYTRLSYPVLYCTLGAPSSQRCTRWWCRGGASSPTSGSRLPVKDLVILYRRSRGSGITLPRTVTVLRGLSAGSGRRNREE